MSSANFADRLAAREVGVAEWVILRALYDRPLAPSLLAETLGMTRGAVTKLPTGWRRASSCAARPVRRTAGRKAWC